jgi:hypothetical protein
VVVWQSPPADLGERLVRQMLRNWRNPDHEPVLRAVMQIAGNEPAVQERLRYIIERSIMRPSAQALASMDEDDIVALIAPAVQRYLDGDVSRARSPR